MTGTDLVITALLLVAAGGCVSGLYGVKSRVPRIAWFGAVTAWLGFLAVEAFALGVFPRRWLDSVDKALLSATPSATISPASERALFDQAERGSLPTEEFVQLLGSQVGNRSIGSRGGSCLVEAIKRVRSGTLPSKYVDALAGWLVDTWPSWQVTGMEQDEVPIVLTRSEKISPEALSKFHTFMVGVLTDPAATTPNGWHEALGHAMLTGKLPASAAKEFLVSLPEVNLELTANGVRPSGQLVIPAGAPFRCGIGASGGLARLHTLPWSGTVRLVKGGAAMRTTGVPISGWRVRPQQLARLVAPDEPGEYEVTAEIEVQLTQDAMRDAFAANLGRTPKGVDVRAFQDVTATKEVTIKYTVVDAGTVTAPAAVELPPERVQECVRLGRSRTYSPFDETQFDILVNNPPVALAMSVYWVTADDEMWLDWFCAPPGVESKFECTTHRVRPGGRLMLRPDAALIGRNSAISEYYAGPEIQPERAPGPGR
jgi:hypothetical protein